MKSAQLARIAERVFPGGRLVRSWPLVGGVSATVIALEIHDGDAVRRVVVRQHGAAGWKELEDDVTAMEFGVLVAASELGLPVPRPLLLDAPASLMVVEFVEGTTEIAEAALPDALRQMASLLARLHAVDPAAIELPALPPRTDPVPSILRYFPSGYESIRPALQARGHNPPSLVHGDYWSGNILWNDGHIAAVLDWEDAAIGDPLSDLAGSRIEVLWRHGDDAMNAYTEHYLAHADVDLTDLPLWELHVATGAAATMANWGLDAEVEAAMRDKTDQFINDAAERLRRG